jgi:hypothetical protein
MSSFPPRQPRADGAGEVAALFRRTFGEALLRTVFALRLYERAGMRQVYRSNGWSSL